MESKGWYAGPAIKRSQPSNVRLVYLKGPVTKETGVREFSIDEFPPV